MPMNSSKERIFEWEIQCIDTMAKILLDGKL